MPKASQNNLSKPKQQTVKITAEQTIIIIRLIKKYKAIWDTNHPDFRNRQVRNNAFKQIGSYFELTAEDLRRKYRRFRNCYAQELKQIRGRRKQFTNLFYFDEMEFLRDQIEPRLVANRSPSPVADVVPTDDNTETDEIPIEALDEAYSLEPIEEYQIFDNNSNNSNPDSIKEVRDVKDEIIEIEDFGQESTFEKTKIDEKLDSAQECVIEEEQIEKDPKSPLNDKGDEFDIFAGYLASQLREMDKISALQTMEELQSIIFKRRIQILKQSIN